MSNPLREWLDDRESQFIKANKLRDWCNFQYPDGISYFNTNKVEAARLDAKRELIDELMSWIDEEVEYR